jgi:predicted AlkP superfamily phosphohydrolase/phosphomutase
MSFWYGAHFLLREILFKLGVARPADASPASWSPRSAVRAVVNWGWTRLHKPLRVRLATLLARFRGPQLREGLPTIGVDVSASRCFAVGNGLAVGGIRLNLAGREPRGILARGAEAEAFVEQLSADLLEIVDDRTGRPLVRRVLRTAELYQGPHLEDLPDILVEWSDDVATGSTRVGSGANAVVRARSPKIGVVEGSNDYGRTGEHRPEGFFVAAGPGVTPGRLERMVSVMDFAPTIASLFGVALPVCDGEVIPEIGKG